MKPAFVLTHAAARDLEEILDYVAETGGEVVALRVQDRLHEALSLLARYPRLGHQREDLALNQIRFWSVSSYVIVYRDDTSPLQIERVLHGARDLQRLLEGL